MAARPGDAPRHGARHLAEKCAPIIHRIYTEKMAGLLLEAAAPVDLDTPDVAVVRNGNAACIRKSCRSRDAENGADARRRDRQRAGARAVRHRRMPAMAGNCGILEGA
ncbi:hypothetical protein [Burkholderia ubonensis]|uniref:hypothetical protein n=1 Tax=Burkholderia ubonensis TaxID=101571 RepID=UPI0012FB8C76|nr:hypothetical protein [Burkholderia ubonensis]